MTEEQTYFVESRASPVEDVMLLEWKPCSFHIKRTL